MSDDPVSLLFRTSLAPWLSVRRSVQALEFYKAAFGAVEVYHLDGPEGGVVSRLSIGGGEFWLSDESPENGNFSPESLGGATSRMILIVADPDTVFARALAAGAAEVSPMAEDYGWRIGRIRDPFGQHWEIGRPIIN
jgi:PhnB protein